MEFLARLSLGLKPGHFINSFCDPALTPSEFRNELGRFTPCFTDVVILGLSHAVAVCLYLVQLHAVLSKRHDKYQLTGPARRAQLCSIVAAAVCLAIPLFQINARLGESTSSSSLPAPYEWFEVGLATAQWALLLVVLCLELGQWVSSRRWVLRFSVVLVCASEMVKLRFVLIENVARDYFFWLYITYVVFQVYLALVSLVWFPAADDLVLSVERQDQYLPLAGSSAEADGASASPASEGECPEVSAGLWAHYTFSWMTPLVQHGYQVSLTQADIWRLPKPDRVESMMPEFDRVWKAQLSGSSSPSLFSACWAVSYHLILTALPYKLIVDASQFVGPMFLNLMLGEVSAGGSMSKAYLYAGLMFIGTQLGTFADNQHFQRVMRTGFRLKSVLNAQVHQKVFGLTPASRARYSSGRIFNLVSADAETIQSLCQSVFGFVSVPLRIFFAMWLLWRQLGVAALVSTASILLVVPINTVLVRASAAMLKRALQHTDERTKLEGELISGVEVVKCSTWEMPFQHRIEEARNNELQKLWRVNLLSACTSFLISAVPTLVPVVTFGTFLLLGNTLSAAQAFTALALFNVLRFPLFQLPQLVQQLTQARVSLTRIQEFLAAEELPEAPPLPPAAPGEVAVQLSGSFTWDPERPCSLSDVDLNVSAGELLAVVGTTGCGKSTILASILGLTQQTGGEVMVVRGRVAYVPDSAFILNATVRDNVLFGRPYDPQRYHAAITAACLDADLNQLAGGDQTELGERGVNVSGGQKQRISLARAVYADADVYLLDDPLSALDSRVGRRVFETCIKGALKGKTIVLVTNQLQYTHGADRVAYCSNSRISELGSFQELLALQGDFAKMMQEAQVEEEDVDDEAPAPAAAPAPAPNGLLGNGNRQAVVAPKPSSTHVEAALAPGTKLTTEEGSATGALSWSVVEQYAAAMGSRLWLPYLGLWFVAAEGLRVGTTVWLSHWTDEAATPTARDPMFYLYIYAAISLAQLLAQLTNLLDVARLGLRAASSLHMSMLTHLLAAPMAFFHTTPIGRIINRLTKDTADIDRSLSSTTAFAIRALMTLASTVVLVGVIAPFALPPLIVVLLFFWWLYQYYQASARQVKRLDAVSRSPVFQSVSDTISGVATIRAFGIQQSLKARHAQLVDSNAVMSLVGMSMNRWLSVRLETLGALSALMASVVALEQRGTASMVGLLLSYALQITSATNITLRASSMAENMFNSVERVLEYCRVPAEAAAVVEGGVPPNWPDRGGIQFREVKMRYRAGLPLVLKGVTWRAEAMEKVGVVGRTGAGKSSLIGCLFRLTELDGGSICIDDVDISRIGLRQLRSSLAIIPQVPVLFTGSIRLNLSPFDQHDDAQLWSALERAHLAAAVRSWPEGLSTQLREGGSPLSAGQKQLLALARALLNPSRVLVLDEATANVDVETDALIQKTIREQFSDRTIITIAHRLHTIIDCDKVLVLDAGQVAEFGRPATLLDNADGVFSHMVADTGEASARFLRGVATGQVDVLSDAFKDCVRTSTLTRQLSIKSSSGTHQATAVDTASLAYQLADQARAASQQLQAAIASLAVASGDGHDEYALVNLGSMAASSGADVASVHRALAEAMSSLASMQQMAEAAGNVLAASGGGDRASDGGAEGSDGTTPIGGQAGYRAAARQLAGILGRQSHRTSIDGPDFHHAK